MEQIQTPHTQGQVAQSPIHGLAFQQEATQKSNAARWLRVMKAHISFNRAWYLFGMIVLLLTGIYIELMRQRGTIDDIQRQVSVTMQTDTASSTTVSIGQGLSIIQRDVFNLQTGIFQLINGYTLVPKENK